MDMVFIYFGNFNGYRSNDDRISAMNIQLLGTQWVSGTDERPRFEKLTVSA